MGGRGRVAENNSHSARCVNKPTPKQWLYKSIFAGVGGHPGFFHFFGSGTRFFIRIFTGDFWIFLRTRCPLPKHVLVFLGGFFWPFSGFPSFSANFYPHCNGVILKKMDKFLADTRFGHYHQRVA